MKAALAALALLITKEPERHHICEVAMANMAQANKMGEYYCKRNNQELKILGVTRKEDFTDCSLHLDFSATTLTWAGNGESWAVQCKPSDLPKQSESAWGSMEMEIK